jgi:hypothetical protein
MLHACLHIICFVFCYTLWRFYAFSGTNLLTRWLFPIFCCFCVSEKLHRKYSWNWTKQKPNLLFLPKLHEDRRWDRGGGAASQAHHQGTRPRPWPCRPMARPAGPTSNDALLPISSPRREKSRGWISFPRNILQAAAVAIARSGGSRSSSRHLKGICPRGNNKVVIILFHVHNRCLFFMLELY